MPRIMRTHRVVASCVDHSDTEDDVKMPIEIRSQQPDVTVVVGSGDSMKEYPCYRVILSFASPYFDSMLTANMAENRLGRIHLPDKNPKEWEVFSKYIHPSKMSQSSTNHDVDDNELIYFAPWFDQFGMLSYRREADRMLARKASIMINCHSWDCLFAEGQIEDRKKTLKQIIDWLRFACDCNLDKAKDGCERFLKYLLIKDTSSGLHQHNNSIICLDDDHPAQVSWIYFDKEMIKELVRLFLPIVKEGSELRAEGQSTVLWDVLEHYDAGKSCSTFSIKNGVTPDVMNLDNPLLLPLIQSEIRRYEACKACRKIRILKVRSDECLRSDE